MNPELFRQLLDKYILETLSEAERGQLAEMLALPVYQDELTRVLQGEWTEGIYAAESVDEQRFERVYRQLLEKRQPVHPVLPGEEREREEGRILPFYKRIAARWIAAAIVLFLLTGVAYVLWIKSPAATPLAHQTPRGANDIAPGSDGALLTLADGSTLVLDTARNGALADQGNTRLVKRDHGQLSYEPAAGGVEILYNTLSTPRGKQFRVQLPDGSRVWLNSASSLRYPTAFRGPSRKVIVTGEAYFEVAGNAAMPFIVEAGGQELKVLGTRFNINAYPDEASLNTTLLEGSVKLQHADREVMLRPGEQSQLTEQTGFRLIDHADLEGAVAWKNGFFSFRHADIRTVIRQLSRWYDLDVEYQGNPLASQSFSGEIGRNLGLADLLNGLQLTQVHYRIEQGKKLVILP